MRRGPRRVKVLARGSPGTISSGLVRAETSFVVYSPAGPSAETGTAAMETGSYVARWLGRHHERIWVFHGQTLAAAPWGYLDRLAPAWETRVRGAAVSRKVSGQPRGRAQETNPSGGVSPEASFR